MERFKKFAPLLPVVVIVLVLVIYNIATKKGDYGDGSVKVNYDSAVEDEENLDDEEDETDYDTEEGWVDSMGWYHVGTTEEVVEEVTESTTTEEVVTTEETATETSASTESPSVSEFALTEENYIDVLDTLILGDSNFYENYTTDNFKSIYAPQSFSGDLAGENVDMSNSSFSSGLFVCEYSFIGGSVVTVKVQFTLSESGVLDTWVVTQE